MMVNVVDDGARLLWRSCLLFARAVWSALGSSPVVRYAAQRSRLPLGPRSLRRARRPASISSQSVSFGGDEVGQEVVTDNDADASSLG